MGRCSQYLQVGSGRGDIQVQGFNTVVTLERINDECFGLMSTVERASWY